MKKMIVFLKKVKGKLRRMLSVPCYLLHRAKIDLISTTYRKYPLQDKVVFANFNGRGFGCNPKYIAQELLRRQVPYDIVWLVNDMDTPMPAPIRKVPFDGKESYYELATAKVIVNNVKGDLNFRKRNGQFYIQTWHAGYGFKRVEKNALKKLPKDYILESKRNSRDTDLFLSGSQFQSDEYREAFWCTCEILERGLPRNDAYFGKTQEELLNIKASLGLTPDAKICMYAPTFRTGEDTLETYGLDLKRTVETLRTHWGEEWVLLFRHHPNLTFELSYTPEDHIIDASGYPDMQELLLVTDMLISDYSTAAFDAAFLNKIVLLYAADLEEYRALRGLNDIFYTLPYPLITSNDQMEDVLTHFYLPAYNDAANTFLAQFKSFDDGHAAEAVADRICSWING